MKPIKKIKKTKRAFILSAQELVGLALAIIILVTFISCSVKYGGLLSKGQDSFDKFVGDIQTLGETGREGEPKTSLLILDPGTRVLNFWSSYINEAIFCTTDDVEEHWLGPQDKCGGNDCICLVQEYTLEETDTEGTFCGEEREIKTVTPTKMRCIEISPNYYIYGIDFNTWLNYETRTKRFEVQMIKKGKVIYVCQNPPCTIPEKPILHPVKSPKPQQ